MSKAATRVGATPTKRLAEDGGASRLSSSLHSLSLRSPSKSTSTPAFADSSSDICPVCKSSRYLNPNMKFLVNPECYHKMCESCVDRIFSHGPAPCPIAGCKRTLRKAKFRNQTFEDLRVEREVDIRRRVAKILNKTEEDFDTLLNYNNYLETVETTTFNLIYKIDVEATERRLQAFAEVQRAEALSTLPASQASKIRSVSSTQQITDSKQESSTDRVVLKKSAGQRKVPSSSMSTPDPFSGAENGDVDSGFNFHGLKKRVAPEPEKPYDPYGGWSVEPQYFILQDDYDVEWLKHTKDEVKNAAGGYDMKDFYTRALCDAFSGFGVFIDEEMTARDNQASGDAVIGTQTAAAVAAGGRDVHMDDLF
ncbi:CDK-activating kinase assembly factor [Zopfia rhizophila CBS 207.26]|uniref:RNA polymerase II transcription factor B subunit 3 n=1 Tax=Zopfia rhizophila CBS 207.26 TaxID=1314779 RepID=A0A6A6EP06_9PEZI|nr:CDK-activating kinase assembly factor [Zopfia rhizophila CBS 207.26]